MKTDKIKYLLVLLLTLLFLAPSVIVADEDAPEGSVIKTGLYKDSDGIWRYYENGVFNSEYNGLAKNKYGWFKVTNGVYDPTYTGIAKNQYGWFYVENGKHIKDKTGLVKRPENGRWYYIQDGKLNWEYNGLAKNKYGWFKVTNGVYDPTYTGIAKNQSDGKWYYVEKGKLNNTYNGVILNPEDKNYYFTKNGKIQYSNQYYNGNNYYVNSKIGIIESVNSETFVKGMKFNLLDFSKFTWTDGIPSYNKSKIGVDVSSHQGSIDWNKVKNDGVEYVILRVGFRGYGPSGLLRNDARFEEYYNGARSVGLPIGVYFFSQAINEQEAIEEANLMLEATKGKQIDLGYVYDLEDITYDDARTDNMSASQWTRNAVAFLTTIENAGKKGILYTNMNWYRNKYYIDKLYKWEVWLAQYGTKNPSFPYEFKTWQFSESGRVDGISTKVDMNVRFN